MKSDKYKAALAITALLLGVSIVFSFIVANRLVDRNKRLNVAWKNTIVQFSQVADWTNMNIRDSMNHRASEAILDSAEQNLDRFLQQIKSMEAMPYVDRICPFSTQQRLRIFATYQIKVIDAVRQDTVHGVLSDTTIAQLSAINQAWDSLISTLSQESNKVKVFHPRFRQDEWASVWSKAMEEFNKVELVPLDQ